MNNQSPHPVPPTVNPTNPPMQLVITPLSETWPVGDEFGGKPSPSLPVGAAEPGLVSKRTQSPTTNGGHTNNNKLIDTQEAAPEKPSLLTSPTASTNGGSISRLSLYKTLTLGNAPPALSAVFPVPLPGKKNDEKIVIPLTNAKAQAEPPLAKVTPSELEERPTQPYRLRRKSRVQHVAQWEGSDLSWETVTKKIDQGKNAKVWYDDPETVWTYWSLDRPSRDLRVRSALADPDDAASADSKSQESGSTVTDDAAAGPAKRSPPAIASVDYDHRYLQFDETPFGRLHVLVRPPFFDPAMIEPYTGDQDIYSTLPDLFDNMRTSSTIGRCHQARVPAEMLSSPLSDDPDFGTFYTNGKDSTWDPDRARIAEEKGEDIYGFIDEDNELVRKEFRMEILHVSDYSVPMARSAYKQLVKFVGGEPTSVLTKEEKKEFSRQILSHKKDFKIIARNVGRRPLECMVHYYRWKRTCGGEYKRLKHDLHTDYCYECGDGGDLLICDECDHAYHKKCLNPPLQHVPPGDWYCLYCEPIVRKRGTKPKQDRRQAPRYSPPKPQPSRRTVAGSSHGVAQAPTNQQAVPSSARPSGLQPSQQHSVTTAGYPTQTAPVSYDQSYHNLPSQQFSYAPGQDLGAPSSKRPRTDAIGVHQSLPQRHQGSKVMDVMMDVMQPPVTNTQVIHFQEMA